MFDASIRTVMKRAVTVTPATSVSEVAQRMRRRKVGAVIVLEGGSLAGIFTERDVVVRVVAARLDPQSVAVGDVMTRSPTTTEPGSRFGHALVVMHEGGFRHMPVVDSGKVVGIVSARSAMDPDLEEFTAQESRRQQLLRERASRA